MAARLAHEVGLVRRRTGVAAFVLVALLAGLFVASMALGAAKIPLSHITRILLGFGATPSEITAGERMIVLSIRLPRTLLCLITGAGLALSGAVMQGLFRNALADPYLLGLAGGASTGAAVVLLAGVASSLVLPLGAFAGAMCAAGLVLGVVGVRGRTQGTLSIILAGVAVGSLFAAITALLIFRTAGSDRALEIVFWTMGSLGRATWPAVAVAGAAVLGVGTIMLAWGHELDALLLGEREAEHLGVAIGRTRVALVAMAALATAAPLAFVGTIGFVGLITPHIVRLVAGARHQTLLPLSALAGSALLLAADTVARVAAAPSELPVGVVTAFFGVPFFLFLLGRRAG